MRERERESLVPACVRVFVRQIVIDRECECMLRLPFFFFVVSFLSFPCFGDFTCAIIMFGRRKEEEEEGEEVVADY